MIGRVAGRVTQSIARFAGLSTYNLVWASDKKPQPNEQMRLPGRRTTRQKDKERYRKAAELYLLQIKDQKTKETAEPKYKGSEKASDATNTESSTRYRAYLRWLLSLTAFGVLAYYAKYLVLPSEEPLTFDRLLMLLEENQVSKIHIENLMRDGHMVSEAIVSTPNQTYRMSVGNLSTFKSRIYGFTTRSGFKVSVVYFLREDANIKLNKLHSFLSMAQDIFFALAAVFVLRKLLKTSNIENLGMGGGLGNTAKQFKPLVNLETRFKDVAGLADAKLEITEFVDFLKNPQKYKNLGARIPKGALLSGPPGTGKTMLAKACSGEAGVPFFSASGSEFVEIFVGVGASRVRELFKAAKEKTPSIVFIDEIDAIGRKREGEGRGGNDERANTLNQLLVEMDGFGTSTDVIVLAATNRKELLDSALTRPGRFDRSIEISLPDLEGRKEIFMTHLKPIKLSPDKSIEEYAKRLATLTPGFSGADIYNICNEAAILSARQNKTYVESIDFEMATYRIIGGVEKKKIITEKERRTVAYHECGHAVVSWFLEGAHPLLKLTIIPRSKGALGFAQYLPSYTQLESKYELLDKICVILGGRCAEEHFFKRVTTGAQDDLQKVYKFSRSLVVNYGMSEAIGYVSPRESQYEKDYSEELNQTIDEEISKISKECTERARKLVAEHADKIERLAYRLLEKYTLDSKDIRYILGERPFPAKSNYRDYLEQTATK